MLTQEEPSATVSAPQIWDKPTPLAQVGDIIRIPFVPVMQVVDRDILKDGRVWLLVRPTTGSTTEEWVVEPLQVEERQQQLLQKPQDEPLAAGDSVRDRLQEKLEAIEEFEMGRRYGQHDAAGRLHPICTEATCPFSTGYLEGYSSFSSVQQQPQPVKQTEWSVTYDPKWQWYQAWVGARCVGRGATYQEAERIAQQYIATDEMIRRQNAAVLAAYAD